MSIYGRSMRYLWLLLLLGCSTQPSGLCTQQVANFTLTVTDAGGVPAGGVTLTVVLDRTGQVIVPAPPLVVLPTGTYPLIGDGQKGLLRSSGDQVTATAVKGATSATAVSVFRFTACHVTKVSGPDTVQLQ